MGQPIGFLLGLVVPGAEGHVRIRGVIDPVGSKNSADSGAESSLWRTWGSARHR